MARAGDLCACSVCGEQMERVFYPTAMLGRQKPGSFRFDRCKVNAWDDRLAHLRDVEQTQGAEGMRKVKDQVGGYLYNTTLAHRKQNYA